MHEGGGNYLNYLKIRWNKEEGGGNKDFKKRGKLGQGVGAIKKREAGTPSRTMITLIIIYRNAGCTFSAGYSPLLASLIFYF